MSFLQIYNPQALADGIGKQICQSYDELLSRSTVTPSNNENNNISSVLAEIYDSVKPAHRVQSIEERERWLIGNIVCT